MTVTVADGASGASSLAALKDRTKNKVKKKEEVQEEEKERMSVTNIFAGEEEEGNND